MFRIAHLLCICSTLFVLNLALADEVELFDGKSVSNVDIDRIDEGYLYLKRGAKTVRVPLHRVKKVTEAEKTEYCEFGSFEPFELKRRPGYLLNFSLKEERNRFTEPYVRIFVKYEDDKGDRDSKVFSNNRLNDPSRTFELPEINSDSYKNKYFFLYLRNNEKLVAWHLEIWCDGELAYQRTDAAGKVDDEWWKREKILTQSSFTDVTKEEVKEAGGSKDPDKPEENAKDLPYQVSFGQARFKTPIDGGPVEMSVGFQVTSYQEDRVELPSGKLYYVTEDADRIRTIRTHTFKKGGEVKLVNNSYTHDMEMAFPEGYVLAATMRDPTKQRIIYWRLELSADKEVVAVREAEDPRVKNTLAPKWWNEE